MSSYSISCFLLQHVVSCFIFTAQTLESEASINHVGWIFYFNRHLLFSQIWVAFPKERKRSGMQHKLTESSSLFQIVVAQAVLRKRQQWFTLRPTQFTILLRCVWDHPKGVSWEDLTQWVRIWNALCSGWTCHQLVRSPLTPTGKCGTGVLRLLFLENCHTVLPADAGCNTLSRGGSDI